MRRKEVSFWKGRISRVERESQAGRREGGIIHDREGQYQVFGVEFGQDSVGEATRVAEAAGVAHLVRFEQGDAERLAFADNQFDAVICECAFCTFPNKRAAARAFARVLRPGSSMGLADLTRSDEVPAELQGLLAWIACIAVALSIGGYRHYL